MTATLDTQVTAAARPRRRRTVLAWTSIILVLLVIGAIGAAIANGNEWTAKTVLDPDSAGPSGAQALTQLLRDQGVQVEVARSLADARSSVSADGTLVLPSTQLLSDGDLSSLADRAGRVVLLDPSSRDVDLLVAGSESSGYASFDAIEPDCDLRAAANAGPIVPGRLYEPGDGAFGCYGTVDGYGLVATSSAVAIDGTELFTNDRLASGANAALGLGLIGKTAHVVWYMPSFGDSDITVGTPTLGQLTPPWVTPVMILLLLAGGVAAIWRGRRFGPLVAERLPVTVRASETMEGRARLYARSRDAAHAAHALRLGTVDRIARSLGIGPTADAGTIADAAADRLGVRRDVVRGILIHSVPATDAELVDLSDRLRDVEAAVTASVHIERTDP